MAVVEQAPETWGMLVTSVVQEAKVEVGENPPG